MVFLSLSISVLFFSGTDALETVVRQAVEGKVVWVPVVKPDIQAKSLGNLIEVNGLRSLNGDRKDGIYVWSSLPLLMRIESIPEYRRVGSLSQVNAFLKSAGAATVSQVMQGGVKVDTLAHSARDHLARAFSEMELGQAASSLRSGQGQISSQVQFNVNISDSKGGFVGIPIPPSDLSRFRKLFGESGLASPVLPALYTSLPPDLQAAVRDLKFDPSVISQMPLYELIGMIGRQSGIKMMGDVRTSEFRLITTASGPIGGLKLLLMLQQCFTLEWRRIGDMWFLGPPSINVSRDILNRILHGETRSMLSEFGLDENAHVSTRALGELNPSQREFLAQLFAGSQAGEALDAILKAPGAMISGGAIVHVNYENQGNLTSFYVGL